VILFESNSNSLFAVYPYRKLFSSVCQVKLTGFLYDVKTDKHKYTVLKTIS